MAQLGPLLSLYALCGVCIGIGVFVQQGTTPASTAGSTPCSIDGQATPMPDLPEASGIAVSRQVSDRLWAHNDSGEAMLFALDSRGAVRSRVRVTGATVTDWEAIAVGPCQGGSCLFVGDIGDNGAKRSSVTVYRIPEPAANETSVGVAEAIEMTYPDGAHDAEALLVTPDGTIVIVTKGETGPVNVYRVPANARPGAVVALERIGAAMHGELPRDQRITDAAASPDGQLIALRSRSNLVFYPTADFLKGQWREVRRMDLAALREPQGEGVAVGSAGAVYLASEGGGDGQAGRLTRLSCEVQP
jgi:hypothetical protein